MRRRTSTAEVRKLRSRLSAGVNKDKIRIVVSAGTCGQASGANDLIRAVKREVLAKGLSDEVGLRVTGCHGFCEMEPSLLVEPLRAFYPRVDPKSIPGIIEASMAGEVIEDLLYSDPGSETKLPTIDEMGFFAGQTRSLLAQNEQVDPIRIYDYIVAGGYSALCDVLDRDDPAWVVDQVKTSGLRGRGGAGFPAGRKWEFLAAQHTYEDKFLVCNADEGDPGAYMDRSLLEGSPHSILEGMIIGAFATGASQGILYVRAEYPLAIKHLLIAMRQARQLGLLGDDILGTDFCFDIELVRGAGAFVCGEETALIKSIEGKMGEPRQRPPYPVQRGIKGQPTAINNVETWANIPLMFRMGADNFAETGTKGNSGTRVFSLVGKIRNTGLVEVPMGATIRQMLFDIGGGPVDAGTIKAVQTGGPSGGCIPSDLFDLPIDYDSLAEVGSIMGSGGMIVMDESTCMVDVAKYFMSFLKDESCGKCFTCRKGTQRMYELLEDISNGEGGLAQIGLLEELALAVRDTTMCQLGGTASNPVLSTLKYFKDEYLEHIKDGRCRAGVCTGLITYSIDETNCNGCTACVKACPEGVITGEKKQLHFIEAEGCIKCGACKATCKFDAIRIT